MHQNIFELSDNSRYSTSSYAVFTLALTIAIAVHSIAVRTQARMFFGTSSGTDFTFGVAPADPFGLRQSHSTTAGRSRDQRVRRVDALSALDIQETITLTGV